MNKENKKLVEFYLHLDIHKLLLHMFLYMLFAEIEFSFRNYFMLYLFYAGYKSHSHSHFHHISQGVLRDYKQAEGKFDLSPTLEDYNFHLRKPQFD